MTSLTTIPSGIAAARLMRRVGPACGHVGWSRSAKLLLFCALAGTAVALWSSVARAELPATEPDFVVTSWDTDGGVPGGDITALARTPDGYLWLGTEVGLRRFDGVRFVPITVSEEPALGGDTITSLMVDGTGTLWIGTREGTLSRRVDGTFQAVEQDPRLDGAPIESLTAGEDGSVWFATERTGLVHRTATGTFTFVGGADGLPPSAAPNMVRLANGEWWTLARDRRTDSSSLLRLQNGSWQEVPRSSDIWIRVLEPSRDGRGLWLVTKDEQSGRGSKISKLEDGQVVAELGPYPWRQDSQLSYSRALIEDSAGRVWLGTAANGTYTWQSGRGWRELSFPGGLREATCMLEDDEGILWIATPDEVLHRVTRQRVAQVSLPPAFDEPIVTSVLPSRSGTLWIGTESSGVFRYKDGAFEPVSDGMMNEHIYPLFEDSQSRLWVGTLEGLYTWKDDRFERVLPATITGQVEALLEDRQGNLWLGHNNQVIRLKPDGTFQVVDQGLKPFLVWGIAEDREQRIFITQIVTGLSTLQGDGFAHLAGPGPGRIEYRGLLPDDDGSLWMTSPGYGLRRLQDGAFQDWRMEDGLPSNRIASLLDDGAGNLWFGSTKGIFGTSKRALLAYQRGESSPVPFWLLNEKDGLEGSWFLSHGQPVAAQSADGRLWFPSPNGVAVFDPREVTQPRKATVPLIEEIVVDGAVVPRSPDGSWRCDSGVRQLTIHYTCADLRTPEDVQFRYQLEGLDKTWTEAGSHREAHYGQLPPGEYRFRVMASKDLGEWHEVSAGLPIVIEPRWWERLSIRLIFLGAGLMMVWFIGRARLHQRVATLEREREFALEIQEREERVRLATAAANLGIWEWHLDRDEFWATDTFTSLLGLKAGEKPDPHHLLHVIHPEDRDAVQETVRQAMEDNDEYQMEYRIVTADGDVVWIASRGQVERNAEGTPILLRGVLGDITPRKKAEQELTQQRAELAHVQRVATMGQLASTLAHELNQPLGAILRNAEAGELFLAQTPLNMEELQAVFADIKADDQRAGSVINRMRAMLRRQEPVTDPIQVSAFLDQVAVIARSEAQARQTKLHLACPVGIPLVRGDRVQLQQVLLNLILNALDAMDSVPRNQRRLEIGVARPESAFVELTVRDTGPGIAPEIEARLFEPFQTSKSSGLGMGLAISRQIIQRHGGRLWAENNPAGGATFRLTLPVTEA